jgi:hypothetical protein
MKRISLVSVALFAAFVATGCAVESKEPTDPPATEANLNEGQIPAGASQRPRGDHVLLPSVECARGTAQRELACERGELPSETRAGEARPEHPSEHPAMEEIAQ